MLENALRDIASWQTKKWRTVSSLCLDDHQFKKEELESVGELSKECSQIVLKCLYLERIGRPDILWSVNKFARAVTKWTQACDRCLARFISDIHHTNDYRQYCHVGNTAQHCRLGLFQDSDFSGDLEDSKSTSVRVLCLFGSRTFVSISSMCKNQKSVSHSSTESEIISLDAELRMYGLPVLDFWDVVIEVLRATNNTKRSFRPAPGNWCGTGTPSKTRNKTITPTSPVTGNRDRERGTEMLINCQLWTTYPQTHILLKASLSCTSLKITKLWSRWSSKDEVQQCDTCPEPTELLLIGCLTESIWNPKSK